MLNFKPNEVRVLGCLIEKQLATPDYYPMTENALVLAANQKSSRDPVLSLSTDEVGEALGELSRKEFVEQTKVSGSRAFKFQQRLDLRWQISDLEASSDRDVLAILAVLALRGPQTIGQIRQRTERMFFFPDLDHIQNLLTELKEETEERPALVVEDHSVPGRDIRYTHLFCEHSVSAATIRESESLSAEQKQSLEERVTELEKQVSELQKLLLDE